MFQKSIHRTKSSVDRPVTTVAPSILLKQQLLSTVTSVSPNNYVVFAKQEDKKMQLSSCSDLVCAGLAPFATHKVLSLNGGQQHIWPSPAVPQPL